MKHFTAKIILMLSAILVFSRQGPYPGLTHAVTDFNRELSLMAKVAAFVSVMSAGQALFQPANNSLIMSECPRNKLGIAGSINSLTRNLGQITGITLSTTILYSFMSKKAGYRVSDYVTGRDDIFIFGMQNVYRIPAFLCFTGVTVSALRFFKLKYALTDDKADAYNGSNNTGQHSSPDKLQYVKTTLQYKSVDSIILPGGKFYGNISVYTTSRKYIMPVPGRP